MGDVFKEQIVKRGSTLKDTMKRAGLIAAVVVIFLISMILIPSFVMITTAIAIFGAVYLMTFLKVEYEYIFTNGELDIDAIYNKTRRKRMFSGSVKDIEIMAPVDDKGHTGDFAGANETKDFSSGANGPDTYAFLANYKGKRLKIIIEPNEMMMKAFSTMMTPRKLIKKWS